MTTKNEIAAAVSKQAGLTKAQAAAAVDALVDHINIEVRNGRDLTVAGLGTFKRKQRDARQGRNPATGEPVQIAAKRVVAFKAAKPFSDAVA